MIIAKHDEELNIIVVEDPKEKPQRDPEEERKILERFNYYRNGGDLGPTGHGDTCMSDADPGL